MFYPFDKSAETEDYFPGNIAYKGETIDSIAAGQKILSVWGNGQYYLAFYNGKLGFVLSDNVEIIPSVSVDYEAEAVYSANVYNIPDFIKGGDNQPMFVKFKINKWEIVTVLAEVASYEGNVFDWLYIENKDHIRGYISKAALTPYNQPDEMPYTEGKISAYEGVINLFDNPAEENITGSLQGGAAIKIYYQIGDYSYISAQINGTEIKGYIKSSYIAVDNSFQKRKTGLILLFAAICMALVFAVIRRKYFYN
jgi:hypothetical protein